MKKLFSLLAAVLLITVTACSAQATNNSNSAMKNSVIVEFNTSLGPIKVLLYDDTPKHKENFIKNVESGYYDGVLFHRVIKDFMVQTGDPDSKTAGPDVMLGTGGPSYTIPAEILYPKHYHKYGALAAARTGDNVNPELRSSGSQFYIVTGKKYNEPTLEAMASRQFQQRQRTYWNELCQQNEAKIQELYNANDQDGLRALEEEFKKKLDELKPEPLPAEMIETYTTIGGAPHLDGEYTVFGEVIEGMDVVEKIQDSPTGAADRPVEDIKIISAKIVGGE